MFVFTCLFTYKKEKNCYFVFKVTCGFSRVVRPTCDELKWVRHPWCKWLIPLSVLNTISQEDIFLGGAKNVEFIFVLRCQWQLRHSSPQRGVWLIVQCLISHTDSSTATQDGCIMTGLHHTLIIVPAVTVLTFHYFLSVFTINLLISDACRKKHKEPKLTNHTCSFHLVAFSGAMAATCV